MAIFFPPEVPIKFYPWTQRTTAAEVNDQVVHFRDKGMFQFYDPEFTTHRVVVLNSSFVPIAEIVSPELSIDTIGGNEVYTFEANWDDFADVGSRLYITVVDANTNKFVQNYVTDGDFATSDSWAWEGGSISIAAGNLTFSTGSGDAVTVSHSATLKIGSEYTFNVQVTSNTGGVTAGFYNGAALIDSFTVGANTFTFTATDTSFSLQFAILGAGSMVVDFVSGKMAFEGVTPEWISAPFCLQDVENSMTLLHGCANNDYFNMYFETTGFVPRIRVQAQLYDVAPIQEVERSFLTNGRTSNHYVQHVSSKELRVNWVPAYLVNFMGVLFYLDHSYVDNETYSLAEDIEVVEDENAPEIKAFTARITPRTNGVSFKRIVNDPDAGGCEVETSGYVQQGTSESYVMQGSGEPYYPQ